MTDADYDSSGEMIAAMDASAARSDGSAARRAGHPIETCPLLRRGLAESWLDGWCEAYDRDDRDGWNAGLARAADEVGYATAAGSAARRDGHPVGACPHAPGPHAESWLTGWESAETAHEAAEFAAGFESPDEIYSAEHKAFFLGTWGRSLPAAASQAEMDAWNDGRRAARRARAAESERALIQRRRAGYEPRH